MKNYIAILKKYTKNGELKVTPENELSIKVATIKLSQAVENGEITVEDIKRELFTKE